MIPMKSGNKTLAETRFKPILESLPVAVCILDSRARIAFSNTAFQTLVENCSDIQSGLLFTLTGKVANAEFQASLKSVSKGHPESDTYFLARDDLGGSLWLSLSHIPQTDLTTVSIFSPDLLTIDPEQLQARIQTLFGLTGMEARCALLLTRGLTGKAIAAERGVSLPTIRTQLKAIRDKVGVRSSLEVVAIISRLSQPVLQN